MGTEGEEDTIRREKYRPGEARRRWSLRSTAVAEKEQLGGDEKVISPVDWVEDEEGNLERVNRSSSRFLLRLLHPLRECVCVC
jgi:hypothetical protein